jgi:hypothetical protein
MPVFSPAVMRHHAAPPDFRMPFAPPYVLTHQVELDEIGQ